jgi:hypothetical protein
MMRLLFALVFTLSAGWAVAQEVDFQVKVNYQKRQVVDPKVFQTLEQALQEFLNNQKWTEDLYQTEERIRCNLQLTLQEELGPTSFRAEIAISATRPVFNSDYQTTLLNHIDKTVTFSYEQFQPLFFSENTFNNNLVSVLSFYVYIILGLDYDSFSPFGGEPYFQKAQDVLNDVPAGVAEAVGGWRSTDGNQNRYWIIQNFLDPRMRDYRRAWYDYHRQAMDIMYEDPVAARAIIVKALEMINKSNQAYRNAMIVIMFNNAKSNELVEIFKGAGLQERSQFINVMSKVDPANQDKYRKLRS